MTYDPEMPVIDNGEQVTKTMRYTPFYGINHLNLPHDDIFGGGWCSQKGEDWGLYPSNPGGSGFPNEYEEVTPVSDGLVIDIKMHANLNKNKWELPTFHLPTAGTAKNPLTHLGEGNQYGDFTDKYLIDNSFENSHKLHFTDTNNPDPKPVQAITVTFEGVGETNMYVDPLTGNMTPKVPGLTKEAALDRAAKIAENLLG